MCNVAGKYTVEACCVVGNYHSMRGEHEKAVTYFQRALKLNPKFGSAFTLMGYEYMEMKSTLQAIQCYRCVCGFFAVGQFAVKKY